MWIYTTAGTHLFINPGQIVYMKPHLSGLYSVWTSRDREFPSYVVDHENAVRIISELEKRKCG